MYVCMYVYIYIYTYIYTYILYFVLYLALPIEHFDNVNTIHNKVLNTPYCRALYGFSPNNMEKINMDYSDKNIPIPSQQDYKIHLISKTEKFIKRIRWKALEFLGKLEPTDKQTYRFK